MLTGPTCSVRAGGPILLMLRAAGIDMRVVMERLGVSAELLIDPDARLPVAQWILPLWDLAEQLLDDPLIGLHAAENLSRESFDVFSYIATASATFGEAAARAIRYFRLITDGGSYQLEHDARDAWWHFLPADAQAAACRQDSIFALAVVLSYSRLWLDQPLALREVRFHHTDLPKLDELEGFFGVPIQLGAERSGFRFDAADLERPLLFADPKLAKFLERYAEEALAALPTSGRIGLQVRGLLARGLPDGQTPLAFVAKSLAMSERSLQRQLNAENTSVKQLLEEVRRDLATRYLERAELSVAEVACMVGFSETAPFTRAFKKWTGLTPGDYRHGRIAGR